MTIITQNDKFIYQKEYVEVILEAFYAKQAQTIIDDRVIKIIGVEQHLEENSTPKAKKYRERLRVEVE